MTISPSFQADYLRSRMVNNIADARKRVFDRIDRRTEEAKKEIMRTRVCTN